MPPQPSEIKHVLSQEQRNKSGGYLSCLMTKPTKWHVRTAKTQISLGFRPGWSESSLSAWRKLGSLVTHWAHSHFVGLIWWWSKGNFLQWFQWVPTTYVFMEKYRKLSPNYLQIPTLYISLRNTETFTQRQCVPKVTDIRLKKKRILVWNNCIFLTKINKSCRRIA